MGDTSTSNNVFNWVGLGIVDRFIYLTGHRAERGEKGKLPTGWREATDTNSGKPVYKFEGEKQWQWARPSVEAHQWAGPRAKMFFKFLDECEYQYGETGEQYPNNVGHPSGTFTKSCYNIGSRVSCHWKTEAKPPKSNCSKGTAPGTIQSVSEGTISIAFNDSYQTRIPLGWIVEPITCSHWVHTMNLTGEKDFNG